MTTITFPELDEAQGKLDAKRKELHDLFAEAKNDDGQLDHTKVKGYSSGTELAEAVRAKNDEIDDLAKKAEELGAILKAAQHGDDFTESGDGALPTPTRTEAKSVGQQFVESKAHEHKGQSFDLPDVELKTLFQTSAGWTPESTRSGLVVLNAQRPVQVTDLLPSIPTSQAAYKFMEETTFTNNAVEKAEGTAYGEAALQLTERSATIEKIPVFIPVTDEQLEDEEGAMAYLDQRLPFMIQQRLDSQILVGSGTTPNILGINNKTGIQTQAKGTDPVPDAVHKAIVKVRVTGRAMPNAVIFHPNDWQDVRLLRTADGVYIWGSPSESGPERIWGLPVVQSDAQTENTAVVGDFANYSILVVRRGITVKVSDSHDTFFTSGKQAIRADMRAATVWTRAAAFATVTGI